MQAPKNGFFYVLDRTNGKLISGEPFAYTSWATSIDKETGRPKETEQARYRYTPVRLSPVTGRRAPLAADGVQSDDEARLLPGSGNVDGRRRWRSASNSRKGSGTSA